MEAQTSTQIPEPNPVNVSWHNQEIADAMSFDPRSKVEKQAEQEKYSQQVEELQSAGYTKIKHIALHKSSLVQEWELWIQIWNISSYEVLLNPSFGGYELRVKFKTSK